MRTSSKPNMKGTSLVIIFLLELLSACRCMPTHDITVDNIDMVRQLKQQIDALQTELRDLKASMGNKVFYQHILSKRSLPTKVAFHARVSDTTFSATKNDIVKFSQVSTNIGQGYNKDTGIFTAPVTGVYFFTLHVSSDQENYAEACILKNDVIHGTAVSDVRSNVGWDQGSASVVLNLNQGDTVTVKVLFPHGTFRLVGDGKSTFSGFLLTM